MVIDSRLDNWPGTAGKSHGFWTPGFIFFKKSNKLVTNT